MSVCKWDSDRGDYYVGEDLCRHDEYGDPTYHCTARRTCSNHVGPRELTCARCLSRTRQDIRWIRDYAALLPTAALNDGVNSEAANLAGPAADPVVFEARRSIGRAWIYANIHQPTRDWCEDLKCQRRHFKTAPGADRWHTRGLDHALAELLEDDDEWHPYGVLTRWQLMLVEDYRHDLPARLSVTTAADYLDRHLHRVAQDDEQDFPLLRREVENCRNHIENVLHNSGRSERGEPCPNCVADGVYVRLQREFGHWCWEDACERIHYATDEGDRWVCPRNRAHIWTEKAYRDYIEERAG